MDFTYLIALFLSVSIGLLRSLVAVMRKEAFLWKPYFATAILVFALDLALLIDWGGVDTNNVGLLFLSAFFFGLYALIGCLLGSLPVLAGRWLFRKLTG